MDVVQDPDGAAVLLVNPLPGPLDLAADSLAVGNNADGALTIENGGAVSNNNGYIGRESGSTGEVTVDGAGSTWTNSGNLHVGASGNGTLNITGGGVVSSSIGYISHYNSGSTSEVTVDGIGSTWTNSSVLNIGNHGSGTLNITAGGAVSNSNGWIGRYSGSAGEVTIDGAGSTWTNIYGLWVGASGNGTLNITGGGLVSIVSIDGTLAINLDGNGDGFINIATGGILALYGRCLLCLLPSLGLANRSSQCHRKALRHYPNVVCRCIVPKGVHFRDVSQYIFSRIRINCGVEREPVRKRRGPG